MTYRATHDARLRHRAARIWRAAHPQKLVELRTVLKKRFGEELDWTFTYYGRSALRRDDRVRRILGGLGIPASLTAIADFHAAVYWRARRLGPSPVRVVKERHAARPYT